MCSFEEINKIRLSSLIYRNSWNNQVICHTSLLWRVVGLYATNEYNFYEEWKGDLKSYVKEFQINNPCEWYVIEDYVNGNLEYKPYFITIEDAISNDWKEY